MVVGICWKTLTEGGLLISAPCGCGKGGGVDKLGQAHGKGGGSREKHGEADVGLKKFVAGDEGGKILKGGWRVRSPGISKKSFMCFSGGDTGKKNRRPYRPIIDSPGNPIKCGGGIRKE